MNHCPTLRDVYIARGRITGLVRRTPFVESPALSKATAGEVFLKLECLQCTGSFKVRGASNRILSLSEAEKKRGVATFSTGNHGKAVAYVAGRLGIPAVVCLSEHVPAYRARLIEEYGARVHVEGHSQDEAESAYYGLVEERRLVSVVPFDDPFVIAGQGTLALEMLEDVPDLDTVLVPLSGGGLLAGVALAIKSVHPGARVVGVSAERSPVMLESLRAGKPVRMDEKDTLADSLLGGIGDDNRYTLEMIRDLVDDHVVVTEEEIEGGMVFAFRNHSLVIEGAAAVGIAALLAGKVDIHGKKAGILLSGSSVEERRYLEVLNRHVNTR
ncbi:MAG: threonine/serine dehydratase [Spirochaetales bacterium]|nr:threonine/serine dehydratase [Spirochaetales bacterium]